jgi:hypothetical protein
MSFETMTDDTLIEEDNAGLEVGLDVKKGALEKMMPSGDASEDYNKLMIISGQNEDSWIKDATWESFVSAKEAWLEEAGNADDEKAELLACLMDAANRMIEHYSPKEA